MKTIGRTLIILALIVISAYASATKATNMPKRTNEQIITEGNNKFALELKMTSQFSLASVLKSMGMKNAFSAEADFSGMNGRKNLFISAVIHKAYVHVNEEGAEAAAATAVTMELTSIGPARIPIFRADHPFLFLIRDNHSGSILFIGRVMNPKA